MLAPCPQQVLGIGRIDVLCRSGSQGECATLHHQDGAGILVTFSGWPMQNPQVVLWNVERQMATVLCNIGTDAAKARFIGLCLEFDLLADIWFQGLAQATRMDWTLFPG